MGRKSRHYRDESDPLLGFYHQTLAATSSVRNDTNPLYSAPSPPQSPHIKPPSVRFSLRGDNDYDDGYDDVDGGLAGGAGAEREEQVIVGVPLGRPVGAIG